jgi:hypothetical protein
MDNAFRRRWLSLAVQPHRFVEGNGMEEVVGSIPTRSTIFFPSIYAAFLHISHRKELT